MSTRILLIRHGETAWNREKIFRGTYDIPLNNNGRAQASLAAHALESVQIDAAYTSPLSRATETAEIVLASHGIVANPCGGLMDLDYGEWTGLKDEDVAARWPAEHATWNTSPETAKIPGGDRLESVSNKAYGAVESVISRHADQTVVLFAHRVVNKLLVLRMLGLGLGRFPFITQGNCCINEFIWTGKEFTVERINDTAHMRNSDTEVLSMDF